MLSPKRVEEVLLGCLFKKEEIPDGKKLFVIAEGVIAKYAFHPQRLEGHRPKIVELINELNPKFFEHTGGGWTFLNLAFDKKDRHWGEHRDCDNLLCLAIAIKHARIQFPRDMWDVFPGGVPYVVFSKHPMKDDAT